MGVIKDGKVSGRLPADDSFAVHHPGYPSTTSRAIETLGGVEGIVKARCSQSNRLELRFRPEDPYSHPAFGELRLCNNLLLKISKKKSCDDLSAKVSDRIPEASNSENREQASQPEIQSVTSAKENEAQISEPDKSNLCADIVARVSEAYHFDGMVDYQHVLAVHADAARRRKRNWAETEEPFFKKDGFMDMDEEDVMMLLPPLFSLKDVPENIVLRPSSTLSSKKKQEQVMQHCSEMQIERALAIDFNIKDILLIPKRINWEELIAEGSELWESQMAVSKLFDERPIWPKESVAEHLHDKGLKFSNLMLKRLLLGVAYYFSKGPFLRFWIRRGYDPRKDPNSRIYQKTDFRIPDELRSYCDTNTDKELKPRWGDLCSFQVFPFKCQTFFQLFELNDDYIQEEIRKPTKQTTCNSKTGWFSENVLDCLRLRVAVRFLSLFPKPGAEKILKNYSNDFEKSKRTCIYKDAVNPDQNEHQENSKEFTGNEDKDMRKSIDDEEEEIEAEEEEELDAYETLNLAGEDNEGPLQRGSYLDIEINSRTYLQELFGSFPSSAAAINKIQDAETSDGEYQIYEQYSDGNFSDDDDS
ncbi:hypothetical protein SLE2022_106270 [Rubroshorea leprosula]